KINLVLLDLAMPGLDGIEILKRIKEIKKDTNVIMITAYRDAEKVVAAFRLGAYDCIFKPFDFKYLRESITARLLE
ncbi:MAG: response regulator, partial [Elusimicrobiota bacterium]